MSACSTELAPAPRPRATPPAVVEQPAAPAALELPGPVTFATASDVLSGESETALRTVVDYLDRNPHITRLRIEGHTDNVSADNQYLSERRALSVAKWLVLHGVDCKRLLPLGFGDSRPVADNTTSEGRAINRRTVFIPTERDGRDLNRNPDQRGVWAGDTCGFGGASSETAARPLSVPPTLPATDVAPVASKPDALSDACGGGFKTISFIADARMKCIIDANGDSPHVGKVFGFACPAREKLPSLSVSGSGPFSLASTICMSAVYSGRITWQTGGNVKIKILPKRAEYPKGENRHEVRSFAWKSSSAPSHGYEFVD